MKSKLMTLVMTAALAFSAVAANAVTAGKPINGNSRSPVAVKKSAKAATGVKTNTSSRNAAIPRHVPIGGVSSNR